MEEDFLVFMIVPPLSINFSPSLAPPSWFLSHFGYFLLKFLLTIGYIFFILGRVGGFRGEGDGR